MPGKLPKSWTFPGIFLFRLPPPPPSSAKVAPQKPESHWLLKKDKHTQFVTHHQTKQFSFNTLLTKMALNPSYPLSKARSSLHHLLRHGEGLGIISRRVKQVPDTSVQSWSALLCAQQARGLQWSAAPREAVSGNEAHALQWSSGLLIHLSPLYISASVIAPVVQKVRSMVQLSFHNLHTSRNVLSSENTTGICLKRAFK